MKRNLIIILLATIAFSFGVHQQANASIPNDINTAYQRYADIDKALTKDDARAAAKAAGNLEAALKDVKEANTALGLATAISQSNNIVEQRKSFAALTIAMHDLFKIQKPDTMLYIHYCPMAKAYWMDESKSIANPYYGKAMPTCGKTTGMVM